MIDNPVMVLTGGPCGGKTTLINELLRDAAWAGRVAALPEATFTMHHTAVSPSERLFQRVMVHMQIALENGLSRAFESDNSRWVILCHRGSLDPLAYWLDRGWSEDEFFAFTGTTRTGHYRRYAAVFHLVTAADGAVAHYKRWPDAHCPESPEQAVRLDRLLEQVWYGHPRYYRIDNQDKDWAAKSSEVRRLLAQIVN